MTTNDQLISLGEVAQVIEAEFGVKVKQQTPFVWYDRSFNERNVRMSEPMPQPVTRVGPRRSPLWARSQIVRWFAKWTETRKA